MSGAASTVILFVRRREVSSDLLRTNGLANANSTRSPIGDDCYEAQSDGAELLGSLSTPT